MRRTKNVEIEGHAKSFIINELTVAQVMGLMQREDLFDVEDKSIENIQRIANEMLPLFSNVTIEDLKKMAPSEIRTLWDAFKEVNSDFFDVARALGLTEVLETLRRAIMSDFSKLLVSLLSTATQGSSITDIPSSVTQ